MKKILALALALVMICATFCVLTSCKDDSKSDNDTSATTANGGTNGGEDVGGDEGATIPSTPKGKLIMATNAYFPPYEFYEGEKIVGIDAEIAAAIADYLNMELEIQDMEFDTIITAVKEGSADFGMAGMTITEDRLKEVNFSVSYATGVQAVIVKDGSAITTVDDILAEGATYKAGVQQGTTGDTYATWDLGDERVVRYSNGNNAVMALKGGSVDCVIIDNEPAKALVAANPGLKILETEYSNEAYAICVNKENSELLNKINEAIYELTKNGTIPAILDKYIAK